MYCVNNIVSLSLKLLTTLATASAAEQGGGANENLGELSIPPPPRFSAENIVSVVW